MTELRRAVGLRTVVSTGAGMALATVTYVSFIELASYLAGNSSWIAILAAGIMAVLAGSCFAELNSMYPTAAGIKLFIEKAFGEKAAIIISGVYVLGQLSIVGAEIYILSQGISQGFRAINPLVFAAFFILILFYLNLRGIKFAGATQDIMAYAMFTGLLSVSVYGFYRMDFQFSNPFEIGTFDGFIQAVAIGISCFIAFEWVITISEEVTDVKIIPKGMMLALGLLAVTYAVFSMAMNSVLSKEELGWVLKPEGLPIPHILYGKKLLGNLGLYFMIGMAIVASLTSINAGLMTSSRFLYAMARDWSLPKFMARLHPAYATPWVAMVIVTLYCVAVTAFGFITRYILCMILIIAAAECMIYIVIALCLIRLRRTEHDRERGFKIKGGIAGPMLVILIYGFVGGFVLFGPVKPEDVIDQKIALFFILGLLTLATFYVFAVLPGMREKYRKQAEARNPRRRRKGSSGD